MVLRGEFFVLLFTIAPATTLNIKGPEKRALRLQDPSQTNLSGWIIFERIVCPAIASPFGLVAVYEHSEVLVDLLLISRTTVNGPREFDFGAARPLLN
jgi:hypothetical protein